MLANDEAGNAKVGKDIRLYDCRNCVVHAADESGSSRLGWIHCGREAWTVSCLLAEGGAEDKRV